MDSAKYGARRDKFAGGDPEYIRTTQYGTTDKLAARANLHHRYATAEIPWFEWYAAQVLWQPGPVLEVGCGIGAFWELGQPPVTGPITLTDLSDGMVASATELASAQGYKATGQVAPAQTLPFDDAAFAHVVANHMLYHVPRPAEAIAEIGRVLRDDGVATIATNGSHHMRGLKEIESAVFATALIDHTVAVFGLENGPELLDAAFEEVELRRFPDRLLVTEPSDLWAYVVSYPPGEDATPEQLDQLEAEIAAAFVRGSGTVEVVKDVGLFICRGPRRN